jgi:hypothetical protein
VIFRAAAAPRRGALRGRRPRRAEPGAIEPDPVSITRVTVIDSTGFEDEAAAKEWLERCRKDESAREQETAAALRVVNRAVHAHRISAGDPYVSEATRADALQVRLGYGAGDDVVEGQWRAAYVLPEPRRRVARRQMLAPQEQLAAILSGRRSVHASEDLCLRARLDVEQGRSRQAALQLRASVAALAAEHASDEAAAEVSGFREKAGELERAALQGELGEGQTAALTDLLREIERLIRRRRHK